MRKLTATVCKLCGVGLSEEVVKGLLIIQSELFHQLMVMSRSYSSLGFQPVPDPKGSWSEIFEQVDLHVLEHPFRSIRSMKFVTDLWKIANYVQSVPRQSEPVRQNFPERSENELRAMGVLTAQHQLPIISQWASLP